MLQAARSGDIKVLKEQIEQGRRPDLKDGSGMTALHYSVKNGHFDCVNYLLSPCMEKYHLTRIQVSKGIIHMGTPLFMACRDNNISIDIIKALIEADPQAADICVPGGGNALHVACCSERPLVVQMLLAAGTDLNIQSYTGSSPLHTAAQSDELSCLKILLNAGADTSLCDIIGRTALFSAVVIGYMSSANIILNYMQPREINLTNNWGQTVLMQAAEDGYKYFVRKLLSRGADPHIPNNKLKFAIDFTKSYNCAKLLLQTMNRDRLRFLKHREFPYKNTPKKIVRLICEIIPELFALQAVEYVQINWKKDKKNCIHIIRLLLSKLPLISRPNRFLLNPSSTMMEIIDTYLMPYEQDIILFWRDTDVFEKPYALAVTLDRYINLNVDLLRLLASINPRYSPFFIVNREIGRDIMFRLKFRNLNIPKSWELEYDGFGEFTKPVQSLKHLSRCSLREMFCNAGLLSYKDFRSGLEMLGLPKSLQLYVRYLDVKTPKIMVLSTSKVEEVTSLEHQDTGSYSE